MTLLGIYAAGVILTGIALALGDMEADDIIMISLLWPIALGLLVIVLIVDMIKYD